MGLNFSRLTPSECNTLAKIRCDEAIDAIAALTGNQTTLNYSILKTTYCEKICNWHDWIRIYEEAGLGFISHNFIYQIDVTLFELLYIMRAFMSFAILGGTMLVTTGVMFVGLFILFKLAKQWVYKYPNTYLYDREAKSTKK